MRVEAYSQKWTYSQLEQYLALTSVRQTGNLIDLNEAPQEIELSSDLHESLNQLRGGNKERLLPLGFRRGQDVLCLPTPFKEGTSHSTRGKAKFMEELRREQDLIVAGTIHSHPTPLIERIVRRFLLFGLDPTGFSVADFYIWLGPERYHPVKGVVEGDDNLFVFRTKRTPEFTYRKMQSYTKDEFVREWLDRCNIKYLEMGWGYDLLSGSIPRLNLEVAQYYKCALYKGKKDQNLKRLHPS